MGYPLYVIFNEDWSVNRYEKGVNFTSVTGRQFKPATDHSIGHLAEHFVKPIAQTSKPSTEWQSVASSPDVLIEGEGENQTAALVWSTSPINIDAAKAKLRKKAVHCCKMAMFSGWIWDRAEGESYLVQTDEMSRANIAEKGRLADRRVAASDATLIPFRMADNSTPKITPAEMVQIADTVAILRDDCIENLDDVWALIEALPDLDACIAFDCSTGFPAVPDLA
ncbi:MULTISPECIES: DUF4376 domain-containing protein [Thalassospira]|uniref:DUF4376 domain-containing protein n=1 Tax=Thalassospira profundimaris TaxID=502049 RepID=A0A367V9R3_9PROT|nr:MULTISPECIES: DUF4376 domain-containing protein [Thalassospira]KZB73237.1 hypothetical protein AUQ43_18340 [Thalassospira sp. MCCC 1A01148]RCK21112.1 hypothetical protein TH6_15265 [Thalassospira profundimaris]